MNQNDLCLIRKGGFILGPYTYEKTKTLLLQRELKVIDEVVFPNSYWAFLRDCPAFAGTVEVLRKQDLITDEENTETVNKYSTSISYTSSMAKLSDIDLLEGRDKQFVSAVEIMESNAPSGERHYASQSYAKEKSKKGLVFIWVALLAMLASGAFLYLKPDKKPDVVEVAPVDHMSEAYKNLKMGLYVKSLESFEHTYSEDSENPQTLIPYASLLLNQERLCRLREYLIRRLMPMRPIPILH